MEFSKLAHMQLNRSKREFGLLGVGEDERHALWSLTSRSPQFSLTKNYDF